MLVPSSRGRSARSSWSWAHALSRDRRRGSPVMRFLSTPFRHDAGEVSHTAAPAWVPEIERQSAASSKPSPGSRAGRVHPVCSAPRSRDLHEDTDISLSDSVVRSDSLPLRCGERTSVRRSVRSLPSREGSTTLARRRYSVPRMCALPTIGWWCHRCAPSLAWPRSTRGVGTSGRFRSLSTRSLSSNAGSGSPTWSRRSSATVAMSAAVPCTTPEDPFWCSARRC